jgi:hypothetical protein
MDASTSGGRSDAFVVSIGEEAARLWAELPVRVDWGAVEAQCAWLWARARALVVVPAVRVLVFLSLAMTVMILVEKVFVCAVCLVVRVFQLRPGRRYKWEPVVSSSSPGGGATTTTHPTVLVQIPMYNEREVSGHAARLDARGSEERARMHSTLLAHSQLGAIKLWLYGDRGSDY